MKTLHFLPLIALLGLTTFSTAKAEGPLTLRASTGENIRVWYGVNYTTNGNTAESIAYGIHVKVDGAIPGTTRVVLINNCMASNWTTSSSQISYNCEYGNDGTWVNLQNCSVQTQGTTNASDVLRVLLATHGGTTNCYQQIAVSPSYNKWLVDPVSGQNNFNFRFPIPPQSH